MTLTVQEELKDEMGKTVFNMGLTGINQISSIVKNSTDSKEIFKCTLSDSNGVNETQPIIPIINEIVEGVQNCYFKLAKPLIPENI